MDVCPGLHSLKKPTLFCASNSVRLSARERSIWSLSITWVVTVDFRCCSSRPEAVTISVSLSGSCFAVFSAPAENCEYLVRAWYWPVVAAAAHGFVPVKD